MAATQVFFVLALAAGAIVFLGYSSGHWFSPTQRALKRARKGNMARALADLEILRERKPSSAAVHGALGQVYLMDHRPREAEAALRRALELSTRSASHHGALGWALVAQGKFDEALQAAQEASRLAREDFEIYCLYCGLMAHHGRGAEVAELFEFLKRSSIQIQKLKPRVYEHGLKEKFEFAQSKMNSAGFA